MLIIFGLIKFDTDNSQLSPMHNLILSILISSLLISFIFIDQNSHNLNLSYPPISMGVQLPPYPTNPQSPTESIIHCTGQKQAMQICVNQYCQNNRPFTCGTRKCVCQQEHKLCSKASIDYIVEFIKAKVQSASLIGQEVCSVFEAIIEKLFEIKEKLKNQINSTLKYSSLSETELTLLKIVEKNQSSDSLSGEVLSKMWKQINLNTQQSVKQTSKSESSLNKLQQKVATLEKSINQGLDQFIHSYNIITKSKQKQVYLYPLIAQKYSNHEKYDPLNQQKSHSNSQSIFLALSTLQDPFNIFDGSKSCSLKQITSQMLSSSSIITKSSQVSDLIGFFCQKPITTMRLLFKASDHKFSIQKYNDVCSDQSDTVILCKTKKNRIIGGYSPLSFKSKSWYPSMQSDHTQQTFLFTLTHNQKFPIRDWQNAIIGGAYTLKFGMDQFVITDKADTTVECKFALSNSFRCPNYKPEDPESNLLLNGNSTCFFSVREWEVWKVEIEKK